MSISITNTNVATWTFLSIVGINLNKTMTEKKQCSSGTKTDRHSQSTMENFGPL